MAPPPKRPTPTLYDLFWREQMPLVNAPLPLQSKALLRQPDLVPAMILYPALLTPAVHRREAKPADDWFEILVAAPDMAEGVFAQQVNLRLQVQVGLDPRRTTTYVPLFDDPSQGIEVEKVEADGSGIIHLKGGFRGILHKTFKLPEPPHPPLRLYRVRIGLSCLARAATRDSPKDGQASVRTVAPHQDLQDRRLYGTLLKLNGPELQGKQGRGFHCFEADGGKLNLAAVDLHQPIRAYHPLFVFEQGALEHANLGHASDLHLNARQAVLAQSDAKVIDTDLDAVPRTGPSKRIGELVNVYTSNFSSILRRLHAAGADVLLLGGDLVDHHRNCWPFFEKGAVPAVGEPGNPAMVWKLVGLKGDDNYQRNYQAFVDLLSFYSLIREYVDTTRTPAFVVAGNHDAYEHAYGIAPRVAWVKRANEGIPADQNLTMHEAILAFGESFGEIKQKFNFEPKQFEWFFNVLTPFSDYAVELPRQRIVGLHWGESENMISAPTGHGFGHLPRANDAAKPEQVALVRDGFRAEKRTVLFTHFTFVSYKDSLQSTPEPVQGSTGNSDTFFGDHDFGTFNHQREALYGLATDAEKMQCVFTGHSHRKGLYTVKPLFIGKGTSMYNVPSSESGAPGTGRPGPGGPTPIIVSDCAGPLPRINLVNEFLGWGSDRPAGTLARVGAGGKVQEVVSVTAAAPNCRPRLAVALEYLQVLEGTIVKDAVFGPIVTERFRPSLKFDDRMGLRFKKGKVFERVEILRLADVQLWCKPAVEEPWLSLELVVKKDSAEADLLLATVPDDGDSRSRFLTWLTAPRTTRYMSLGFRFAPTDDSMRARPPGYWKHLERYDIASRWDFEVDCISTEGGLFEQYRVSPRLEAPNFGWRKKFAKYRA